jgi:hypothetical protein
MSKEAESCLVFPLNVDVNVISDEELISGDGFEESSCMYCRYERSVHNLEEYRIHETVESRTTVDSPGGL